MRSRLGSHVRSSRVIRDVDMVVITDPQFELDSRHVRVNGQVLTLEEREVSLFPWETISSIPSPRTERLYADL